MIDTMTEAEQAAMFRWMLSNRAKLCRAIRLGLNNAIHDHGDITREKVCSAEKRVYGELKSLLKQRRREMEFSE